MIIVALADVHASWLGARVVGIVLSKDNLKQRRVLVDSPLCLRQLTNKSIMTHDILTVDG